MPSIKRVPTVLSNYHEGCGENYLGNCCLLGTTFPLYTFKREKGRNGGERSGSPMEEESGEISLLDMLLMGEWEDRMEKGLFRYDVTTCKTKIIPGEYGFIAQLNEGRHLKKRPREFRIDKVLQPFDTNKFNFTKIGQEEVLFLFEEETEDEEDAFKMKSSTNSCTSAAVSPTVVAINASPIEYGHVLLIPHILECLPQRIDDKSLLHALHMAVEASNPFFRVGYNSLGAFATINHLHFQGCYLSVPFPVEKAPTRRLTQKLENGVDAYELQNYPVRGFVFEGGQTVQYLSRVVSTCCLCLQENNIPFNLLISDCGRRVFLFPQCYAEKQTLAEVSQDLLETQMNPAVWEISGHMVLKRKQDFEDASEEYAWNLLAEASLSEVRFEEVKACVFEATHGNTDAIVALDASEKTEGMGFLEEDLVSVRCARFTT